MTVIADPPRVNANITIGQAFAPLLAIEDFYPLHPVILYEGNRGSAKTRAILSILLIWALRYPGSSWVLWRSARTRLTETVLKTLEMEVFPAFGMAVPGGAGQVNRHDYKLPNGSRLVADGLDDPNRQTSASYAGGYLNEGIEIGTENEVTGLLGCLREPTVPDHLHVLLIDTNPGAPGFWLNKKAETVPNEIRRIPKCRADYDRIQEHNAKPAADPIHRWKRVICGWEDNPGYFDLDAWKFHPLGERYVKTTLSPLTGTLRDRWVERRWTARDGAVYGADFLELHQVPPFPRGVPSGWPIVCGYNPGWDHPCGWLWFAVAPNDHLYVVASISGSGISLPTLAERVKAMNADKGWVPTCYGDPQYIYAKKQETGKDTVQLMAEQGIQLQGWPLTGGQMDAQVQAVRNRWINRTLFISTDCQDVIESTQGWSYKRNASGELTGRRDEYEQEHKEIQDCIRGIVAVGPTFESPACEVFGGIE